MHRGLSHRYYSPDRSGEMSSFYADSRPLPDTYAGRAFVNLVWSSVITPRDLQTPIETKDYESYRTKGANSYFESLHIDPMCTMPLCDQLQWRINELGRRIGLTDEILTKDMSNLRSMCCKGMTWSAVRFVVARFWEFHRFLIKQEQQLDEEVATAYQAEEHALRARAMAELPDPLADDDCIEFVPETPPGHDAARQVTTFKRTRQAPKAKEAATAASAAHSGPVRITPYKRIVAAFAESKRARRPAPVPFDDDDDFVLLTPAKRHALERRMRAGEAVLRPGYSIEGFDVTQDIPESDH